MKWQRAFLFLSGVLSLTANVLAILGYFTEQGPLAGWQADSGMRAALTLVLLIYSLSIWSAYVWRWTTAGQDPARRPARRPAAFLINLLATYPLLTVWLYLLFSAALFSQLSTTERWMLAMASAWGATPFLALGLIFVGETLGPLTMKKDR
jgi:hypothetical protein